MLKRTALHVITIIALSILILMTGCSSPLPGLTPSPGPTSVPTVTTAESISTLLAAYSQDLAGDFLADGSIYSAVMKELLQERKLFYNEFFYNALHSNLVSISSTYDVRSIDMDAQNENTFTVKAAELIYFTARYRLEADGHPLTLAANWAIAHTDDPKVKQRLAQYISMNETSTYRNSTQGYDTNFVVEHTFIIRQETNKFLILQDAYTDANPQDNPTGTDVIEWQNGNYIRRKPDYSGYPDYKIYHTPIEELGQTLLDDYSK